MKQPHPPNRRRTIVLAAPVVLAVLLAACARAASDTGGVAGAVDACSRVGVTAELAECETSVNEARRLCAGLEGDAAARCGTYVQELWVAAIESYHLVTGKCGALTSERARSLCLTASAVPQAGSTATAVPLADPAAAPSAPPVPSTPREDDDRGRNEGRGNAGDDRRDKDRNKDND